jgi:CHAT domain-containing protein
LAFVVVKDRPCVCVSLGSSGRLTRLIKAWRAPFLANPPGAPDDKVAQELRRQLWLPLEKHLAEIDTILVSPDGALCGLPFAALPGASPGTFLVEQRAFAYVPSGRPLLRLAEKDERAGANGLLLVGGLTYGKAPRQSATGSVPPRFAPWRDLPGTQLEAERIEVLFRASFPRVRPPRRLRGATADKTALQQELTQDKDKRPFRYLHLATHGYFEPPASAVPLQALASLTVAGGGTTAGLVGPLGSLSVLLAAEDRGSTDRQRGTLDLSGQSVRTFGRNPQLLCGLVLANANSSPDRGLLSAEEVAHLDLRGTDLVVLSACDTGLGKVASGEGVLGLQRAFQSAGARATVASLWSVSDPATIVLMEEFYRQLWQKEQPPVRALHQAQLFVLRNPGQVVQRARQLRQTLVKRGVSEGVLASRGVGKQSVLLPSGGKALSPVIWWAPWVLSGTPSR